MRKEYEMNEEQLQTLLAACKPMPYMAIGTTVPRSLQERANAAWEVLGRELSFKHMTVEPVRGKDERFFTAEVVDEKS